MNERLYRTVGDRMLLGVLGGIALRLDIDPSLTRVVYVIALIVTGFVPLFVLYLIAAVIIPEAPPGYEAWARATRTGWGPGAPGASAPYGPGAPAPEAWPAQPADSTEPGTAAPGALWPAPTPAAWPPAGSDAAAAGLAGGAAAGGTAPFVPGAGAPGVGTPDAGATAPGGAGGSGPTPAGPGPGWGPGWDATGSPGAAPPRRETDGRRTAAIGGIVLVGLGTLFLVGQLAPDIDWSLVWPSALIAIGVLLLIGSIRRN
jgi:phage shock protein C